MKAPPHFHEFCDTCPNCRPVLFDPASGRELDESAHAARIVNQVWDRETTYEERKAWVNVCMHNSRNPQDLALFSAVNQRFEAKLKGSALN